MKASEFGVPAKPETWAFSLDEEDFSNGRYLTREIAIAEAQSANPGRVIWVAQVSEPNIFGSDADDVIEQLNQSAMDDCGEYAEDYLSEVPKVARQELDEALKQLIGDWLTKHSLWPDCFYSVGEMEKILPPTT